MVSSSKKNKNGLNIFLNEYFNIVLAVILIVFLLAAYFLVIGPKLRNTRNTVQFNIESQIRLYNSSQRKLANLKMINSLYQKIKPTDLQKFNSVLPDSYIREQLYGELEEIASSGGWILSSMSISSSEDDFKAKGDSEAPKTKTVIDQETGESVVVTDTAAVADTGLAEQLGRITVEASMQAVDYAGFKRLLKTLENNLRLFDITEVSFSPSSQQVRLKLDTYYYNRAK